MGDLIPRGGFTDAILFFQDPPATSHDAVVYLIAAIWMYAFFCLGLYARQQLVFSKYEREMYEHYYCKESFSHESFELARQYDMTKESFDIASKFYKTLIVTHLLKYECLYQIWVYTQFMVDSLEGEVTDDGHPPPHYHPLRSVLFTVIIISIWYLIELPLAVYFTFGIEEWYGFNNQTVGFFIMDNTKRFIVTILILGPIAYMLPDPDGPYNDDPFGTLGWIISVIVGFCTIEVTYVLAENVIVRLFLSYSQVPPGEKLTRLQALCNRVGFPSDKITVVSTSKYTKHANSRFFGFIFSKRIYLYDNILHKCKHHKLTDGELEGILAYELGVWSNYHNAKRLIVDNIYGVVTLWVFSDLVDRSLHDSAVVVMFKLLPFMMRLIGSGGFFLNCLNNYWVYEADRYATKVCGKGEELKLALIKLYQQNSGFTVWDSVFSLWYHPNPNLYDRLDAIDLELMVAETRLRRWKKE